MSKTTEYLYLRRAELRKLIEPYAAIKAELEEVEAAISSLKKENPRDLDTNPMHDLGWGRGDS